MTATANGEPVTGCAISDVSLNEGDPEQDVAVTGEMSVDLRAARLGSGDGRTYTIEVTCIAGGVVRTETAGVRVPHDQRR